MNSKRFFFVMVGVVGIVSIGLIGATVVGQDLLAKRAEKLVGLKLDNRLLDEQQVALVQANKDIQKYAQLEKISQSIVPQDKDQAQAVREIVKIAADNGINLSNISFPSSSLGQTAPKAPAQTPSENGEAATPAPKVTTPPVTQVKPVDGIAGVYVMEINIQQDSSNPVTYDRLIGFLKDLEQNRRTAQVTSVTVQPNAQDRNRLTFSLVVNVYIKP